MHVMRTCTLHIAHGHGHTHYACTCAHVHCSLRMRINGMHMHIPSLAKPMRCTFGVAFPTPTVLRPVNRPGRVAWPGVRS